MGYSIHRSLFAQQANIRNVKRLQNAQVLLKDPFSTPGHVQQISLVYSILRNSLTVIGLHRFLWHMQNFWKQCVVRLLRRSTRFHCKSCCSTLPLVLLPSKRNKNSPGSPHLKFKIPLSISMAMYPGICDPTVGKNLASLRFFSVFLGWLCWNHPSAQPYNVKVEDQKAVLLRRGGSHLLNSHCAGPTFSEQQGQLQEKKPGMTHYMAGTLKNDCFSWIQMVSFTQPETIFKVLTPRALEVQTVAPETRPKRKGYSFNVWLDLVVARPMSACKFE